MFERWHARRARSCAPLAINYCMRAMALLGSKCSNWRVANAIGFPGEGGSPPPSQTLPTDQSRICLAAHSRMGGRLVGLIIRCSPRGCRALQQASSNDHGTLTTHSLGTDGCPYCSRRDSRNSTEAGSANRRCKCTDQNCMHCLPLDRTRLRPIRRHRRRRRRA